MSAKAKAKAGTYSKMTWEGSKANTNHTVALEKEVK